MGKIYNCASSQPGLDDEQPAQLSMVDVSDSPSELSEEVFPPRPSFQDGFQGRQLICLYGVGKRTSCPYFGLWVLRPKDHSL